MIWRRPFSDGIELVCWADMLIAEHLTDSRPTDARVAAFERLIQGALPEDYKSFLKRENGGRPTRKMFRFKVRDGSEQDSSVHYFYALYDGRVGNIEKTFERFRERIPSGYLAVATDAFGNMILLRTAGQNPGKIYFWDHEKEEDVPTLKNMFPIAKSFTEFLELLEVGPL